MAATPVPVALNVQAVEPQLAQPLPVPLTPVTKLRVKLKAGSPLDFDQDKHQAEGKNALDNIPAETINASGMRSNKL